MKKYLLTIVVLLFMCLPALAAETITLQWEQDSADLSNLKEWNFYVNDSNGPPWTKFATLPYTTGPGPFTTDATLTITGAPGSTVKKYFAATAVNKDSQESTFATGQPAATEVSKSFYIPYPGVSGPFNLMIKVIIK